MRWWPVGRLPSQVVGVYQVTEAVASELLPLRRSVLRDGGFRPSAELAADDLRSTLHLAGRLIAGPPLPVAVASFLKTVDAESGRPSVCVGMMAVGAEHRRRGLGSAALQFAADAADSRGWPMWANARETAVPFYLRHGFVLEGAGFPYVMGLTHYRVVRPAP